MVPMGDAAERVVRRLYQAVADVDFDAAERCFALAHCGTFTAEARSRATTAGGSDPQQLPVEAGTVVRGHPSEPLLDVAVGDTHVVAVQRATASRVKRTLDITGCQLTLVSKGAIQTIRGHYSDQIALDAFWVE
jgi:uncharacterized protein